MPDLLDAHEHLLEGIFREVLEFSSLRRRLTFKANEDARAPIPPSKLQFRGLELDGKMSPALLELVGQTLWTRLKELLAVGLEFDYIAGIPNAGDPIIDALVAAAAFEGVKLTRLRLIKRKFGKQRKIIGLEGSWKNNGRVLLVDDLISHGGSKLEALRVLRAKDLRPVGLLVIVNREQGGVDELRQIGVATYSVLRWSSMRCYYGAKGLMSWQQLAAEEEYLRLDRNFWEQYRGPWPDDLANYDYDVLTVRRALMAHNNGCGVDDGIACDDCWEKARIVVAALRRHRRLPCPLATSDPWPRGLGKPWHFELADDDADVVLVVGLLPDRKDDWTPLEMAKVAVAALRRSGRMNEAQARQSA